MKPSIQRIIKFLLSGITLTLIVLWSIPEPVSLPEFKTTEVTVEETPGAVEVLVPKVEYKSEAFTASLFGWVRPVIIVKPTKAPPPPPTPKPIMTIGYLKYVGIIVEEGVKYILLKNLNNNVILQLAKGKRDKMGWLLLEEQVTGFLLELDGTKYFVKR